jgi:plastocyanin
MRRTRWLCALTSAAIAGTILMAAEAAAGGGGCHPDPTLEPTVARLAGPSGRALIDACAFQPTVLYVDEGAEITWVNKDPLQHTVTGVNVSWGSERFLSQGDTISQRFDRAGVYPFYCLLHPGMVGSVVVGDPDPDEITKELASVDTTGITGGSDQAAVPAKPGAGGDAEPASDALPAAPVLVSLVILGIVAALVIGFGRRRGRLEQGI